VRIDWGRLFVYAFWLALAAYLAVVLIGVLDLWHALDGHRIHTGRAGHLAAGWLIAVALVLIVLKKFLNWVKR
jgi:hypothetical protein